MVLDRRFDIVGLSKLLGAKYKGGCEEKEKLDNIGIASSPENGKKEDPFSVE